MCASILVVDIADNCIFLLGGVTLGQSGDQVVNLLECIMHVFGKVVTCGLFETPARSTLPSNDFCTKNSKILLCVLSGTRVPGLALRVLIAETCGEYLYNIVL